MKRREDPHYVPTPEQIEEECRKIREGWSEDKWAQQSQRIDWAVPRISDPPITTRDRVQ